MQQGRITHRSLTDKSSEPEVSQHGKRVGVLGEQIFPEHTEASWSLSLPRPHTVAKLPLGVSS